MRKSKTQPLKNILQFSLDELNLTQKLKEVRIISRWQEFIGKNIATKTERLYIRNRTLFVYLNSSIARENLRLLQDALPAKINDFAGENLVDKVVIR